MTTEQALNIVDNATGMLQLNRAQHIEIATAIQVLRNEFATKQQPEQKEEVKDGKNVK